MIKIRGARTHNLKDINLDIPRDKITVITGISGSGKSSLAFDTLYAEGQRRYVESLSAYARQFLSMMEKPEVDLIEGLSPAISIEQKATSHNPRSTVGTITEIYDYLRLLFARVGEPKCPVHLTTLKAQTISQMVDHTLSLPEGTRCMILAPIIRNRKGEHVALFKQLQAKGYVRARVNGQIYEIDEIPALSPRQKHTIEIIIDRFKVRNDLSTRLSESYEAALHLAEDAAILASLDQTFAEVLFSSKYACTQCGYNLSELEPRIFSFNNPVGACPSCDGLGYDQFFDPELIIDPEKSLAQGAIRIWDYKNFYYQNLLKALAAHYDFDIKEPFKNLPEKIQQILLLGSKESIKFQYQQTDGHIVNQKHSFEGIIANMKRRYFGTSSLSLKEELAKYLSSRPCQTCNGFRLKKEAINVFINEINLPTIVNLSIQQAYDFFVKLNLKGAKGKIASKINKEIIFRLQFLLDVGLDYLTLGRSSETLSGGEAQRIRLASQIGSGLVGVMYVLDEPSIGLHQRDNERLLKTLIGLRDLGNTLIVVEHDEEAIKAADHVIDIGPGAGVHGGEVVAFGTPKQIESNKNSLTGQYLAKKQFIPIPERKVIDENRLLLITDINYNNLKNVTVSFPLGLFTCITGVSGSGKSSLINDTLYPFAANSLNRARIITQAKIGTIKGLDLCDKVIDINQSPIGRTPRSNPATYTGLFTPIRELFAATNEARTRGYAAGRFSFNVKGGRCEACQGEGVIKVEMHFLADIYVTCDLCKGTRYNRQTLEIEYKGKNIYQILEMNVEQALDFFKPVPVIAKKCQTLMDVGLAYICLGQSAVTLSGGEAQRIKLARELSKRDTGNTLYLLDEPTTGLHFHDIKQLLKVLFQLRDKGNTIIVIEHNLEVIKTADWIIDLGPEGGDKGGRIIAVGTPEAVSKQTQSYTGKFLKNLLK